MCWPRLSRWARDVALRAVVLLFRLWLGRRRQWQMCRVIQDLAFLRRELAESARLDFMLTGIRGHGPQGLDCVLHGLPTVRRQILELRIERPEVLLLLLRQVFPGFHAPQDLLLALGWHGVEVL